MAKRPAFEGGIFGATLCYSNDAVQLIKEIRSRDIRGGRFKEILVDGREVIENAPIPETGQEISFKYLLPTNSGERFYPTIEDLATSPAASSGRLPSEFYVVDIDYANNEKVDSPKLNALFSFCQAIDCLSKLATYHDEKSSDTFLKLVFLGSEKGSGSSVTVLKTKITKEMLAFPALEINLLKGLCSEEAAVSPHYMAQIGIFSASLEEFLVATSQDQSFVYLIANWEAFWHLFQNNLTTFMSGFAFQKAKKEVAEAELKVADQFSKVVNDITGKLLSIPISIAAVVVLSKSDSCLENIALVASLLLAGFLISETVFNQQKQLNRVKDAKDIIFKGFEGKQQNYPEDLKLHLEAIVNDFDDSQTYLGRLLCGFRIFAWAPAIIGCVFFIWRYYNYFLRSCEVVVLIFLITSLLVAWRKINTKNGK